MHFEFSRLRFNFTAKESVRFPAGTPANILRGAFGSILRSLDSGAYARIFEPSAAAAGPSGLADWPRPFVFPASHLDGQTIAPGSPFYFDVNLFHRDPSVVDYFVRAFRKLPDEGLGQERGRAGLDGVDQTQSSVDLAPENRKIEKVAVRFITPTELKSGQQIADRPEFGILIARIRDRLSTLRSLYGAGSLDMDFAEFGRRAGLVEMTFCDAVPVHVMRVSSRTGQRHPLGGFIGMAEYEGELREFVPFLRAAQFSGVGRQTTWGKGQIEIIEEGELNEQHL